MNSDFSRLGARLFLALILALVTVLPLGASSTGSPAQPFLCRAPESNPHIRLLGREFDPVCQPEPVDVPAGLHMQAFPATVPGYYLVQFEGPITPEWKERVEQAGAALYDYVPDFTFIARMDAAARDRVAALPIVRWVGIYQPGYRMSGDLVAAASEALLQPAEPGEFVVSVFPSEDLAAIQAQVGAAGGQVLESARNQLGGILRVRVSPEALASIAGVNGVRWVEPAPRWQLWNNRAVDVMGARTAWDTHALRGAGQIVGVADTGLDKGSTAPANLLDDFENGSGVSRVLQIFDRVGDGANDVNSGHGTHVAGSVLGNGKNSGSTPSTHTYPTSSYVGIAPEASLVFQALENNSTGALSGIPADLNVLFQQSYDAGARIHSNSWGSAEAGSYTVDAQNVDLFSWNHRDFTILIAAGNEGLDANPSNGFVDVSSVGSPGTAKNNITVGATENNRSDMSTGSWGSYWPSDFPVAPLYADATANNPAGMAAFSSRGPTSDGRYKPDISAPGTYVASTKSSAMTGACGWGDINTSYCYMGGTSMATPLTSGATTLMRQYYSDTKGITPTSALLKATLVNGATDLYPGQYASPAEQPATRPNNVEGWGRVNVEASLFPSSTRTLDYFDYAEGLQTNEYDSFTFNMTALQPLKTTLAWTDYPGTMAAGGGLVNDLDLNVTTPVSTVVYPNNANRRGATQYGYSDTGPYYLVSTRSSNQYAVRFTPSAYPVTLDRVLFFAYSTNASGTAEYPINYTVYIYQDNGAGGAPGTLLYTLPTVKATTSGWIAVPVSGVTIASGGFYVSVQPQTDRGSRLTQDQTDSTTNSWYHNGTSWAQWTGQDLNIRAIMVRPDYSTSYDRVNNLEGVDINSPSQTGNYTVRVNAYNVPQGPQPYALVTSAAAAITQTSSYRIFPAGNPALRTFGRTGVKIDFSTLPTSGNVTVTMSKTPPTQPPPSAATFLNSHWTITSSIVIDFMAQVVFQYDPADLPAGMTEGQIGGLYRWNGSTWEWHSGAVDITANTVTVNNVTAFSDWVMGSSPTAVSLARLEASQAGAGVRLEWETASEQLVSGFNLYRSSAIDGTYTLLNTAPISATSPGSPLGNTYAWRDGAVVPGATYYYKLEALGIQAQSEWLGPVSITLPDRFNLIYLPLVTRP